MLHIFYWFNETTGICHLHQFDKKQNKSYNFSEPSVKAKIIALKEKNQSFLLQCHQDKTYCWVNEGSMNYKMRNNCSISAKVSVCWKFIVNKNSIIKQSTNVHNTSRPRWRSHDEEVMMKKSKLIFFTAFGDEIWYFIISLKILDWE